MKSSVIFLLTKLKQVNLAFSWHRLSRHRHKQIFQDKFIPIIPSKVGWLRFVSLGLGALFLTLFLTALIYVSSIVLVLNLRYYAAEFMLNHRSDNFLKTALTNIAFNPNLEGNSKYANRFELAIVIPKIGVDAPIIAGVDPKDKSDYMRALQKGVALAKGTGLPGDNHRSYLFAHSTNMDPFWISRYNAVFYLINKLKPSDVIYIWRNGNKLKYKVTDVKIVGKEDTFYISYGSEEELILQTCYPPGTTLRRLLVIAKPANNL